MIPIKDYPGERRLFPWVMLTIIMLNLAVFAFELLIENDVMLDRLFSAAGVIPVEYTRGVKRLSGVCYFYGSHIETRQPILGTTGAGSPCEKPARAAAFKKLIEATVEKYNLRHVHPDCELSQLVAALELLGVSEDTWEIEGLRIPDFNRQRERERPKPAHPAAAPESSA